MRVFLILKARHTIIGVAYHVHFTSGFVPPPVMNYFIHRLVQHNICQHWGDNGSLGRTHLTLLSPAVSFYHANLQPFAYQAYNASVGYTMPYRFL